MGVSKFYETSRDQAYAAGGHGQVVSRTLHGVVERGDTPLDGGFGEVDLAISDQAGGETAAPKPRIDLEFLTNPLSATPDAAAISFAVMKGVVSKGLYREYYAD